MPEIDQNSNSNNPKQIDKINLKKLEETDNKTTVIETTIISNNETNKISVTKLCYSDVVKKAVKSEEIEVLGQEIEIIGLPYETGKYGNSNKNFEPGSGKQTWAMRAIRKVLGN